MRSRFLFRSSSCMFLAANCDDFSSACCKRARKLSNSSFDDRCCVSVSLSEVVVVVVLSLLSSITIGCSRLLFFLRSIWRQSIYRGPTMPCRFVECLQMGQAITPLRLARIQCRILVSFIWVSTSVKVASIHTSCGGIHVDKAMLQSCHFLVGQSKWHTDLLTLRGWIWW